MAEKCATLKQIANEVAFFDAPVRRFVKGYFDGRIGHKTMRQSISLHDAYSPRWVTLTPHRRGWQITVEDQWETLRIRVVKTTKQINEFIHQACLESENPQLARLYATKNN